jgi:hypothetical protein
MRKRRMAGIGTDAVSLEGLVSGHYENSAPSRNRAEATKRVNLSQNYLAEDSGSSPDSGLRSKKVTKGVCKHRGKQERLSKDTMLSNKDYMSERVGEG